MARRAKGNTASKQRPHIVPTQDTVAPASLAKHLVPDRSDAAPKRPRRANRRKAGR